MSDKSQPLSGAAQPTPEDLIVWNCLSSINPFDANGICLWCHRDEPVSGESRIIVTTDPEYHNKACELIAAMAVMRKSIFPPAAPVAVPAGPLSEEPQEHPGVLATRIAENNRIRAYRETDFAPAPAALPPPQEPQNNQPPDCCITSTRTNGKLHHYLCRNAALAGETRTALPEKISLLVGKVLSIEAVEELVGEIKTLKLRAETAEAALTQAQQERELSDKWKTNAYIAEMLSDFQKIRHAELHIGRALAERWLGPTYPAIALQVDIAEILKLRAQKSALVEAIEPFATSPLAYVPNDTTAHKVGANQLFENYQRAARVYEQVKEKI
jgi:hypothetical protein